MDLQQNWQSTTLEHQNGFGRSGVQGNSGVERKRIEGIARSHSMQYNTANTTPHKFRIQRHSHPIKQDSHALNSATTAQFLTDTRMDRPIISAMSQRVSNSSLRSRRLVCHPHNTSLTSSKPLTTRGSILNNSANPILLFSNQTVYPSRVVA